MQNKLYLYFFVVICIFTYGKASAQYDNIPISNPVYSYLERAEARGYLENMSLALRPMMRYQIAEALKNIRKHQLELSKMELATLEKFERYFEIIPEEKLVLFYSKDDTLQVLSKRFFDDNPKYIYHYADSEHNLKILPLLTLENIIKIENSKSDNVFYGNLGIRANGTLGNMFGYYLQFTNGEVVTGNRDILKLDNHISTNVKFTDLNSDFDFSESGVNIKYKWFYAGISKESRKWGNGVLNSIYISDNAPPFTMLNLGVNFADFSYMFIHGSLLAYYRDSIKTGFNANFPNKYITMHRFSAKPDWGEFALWEGIIYSKRNVDLNYLNPLSFYKSLEHSLRDRDNSMIGFDFAVRPLSGLELKGGFILDDIIFGEIGKNFWGNKTAWNVGAWYVPQMPIDFGFEYSRIEPYTFTHFDYLNNYSNDDKLINFQMQPNSDQFATVVRFWWGQKLPASLKLSYTRHGENEYNEQGNMTRNVGGDFRYTVRPEDSRYSYFLDGKRNDAFAVNFSFGYELFRDFYIKMVYDYNKKELNSAYHLFRLSVNYENF